MKILTAFIFLFLAGCGSEDGRDNHGYGWHYDVQGETGLRVRYQPGQPSPGLPDIEQIYTAVMSCTGIHATGPLVIFIGLLEGYRGFTYYDTGTIIISTEINTREYEMISILKHEFIHHLLHQSGFSETANTNHQSNLFIDCT